MTTGKLWSIEETTLALALYLRSPNGRGSARKSDIQALARQLNRSEGSVSMKLANLSSLDRRVLESGHTGMSNCSNNDRLVWNEYVADNGDIALLRLTNDVGSICNTLALNPEPILISDPQLFPSGPTTRVVTRIERCYQCFVPSFCHATKVNVLSLV